MSYIKLPTNKLDGLSLLIFHCLSCIFFKFKKKKLVQNSSFLDTSYLESSK